jgi:arylsulfatase A-like enzyme
MAEVEREPGVVDLGTPAARALLRRGWSQDEATGERTFVWSDGPESELEFFLAAARDLPLTLHGEPYQFPGAPAQAVNLVVNGKPVRRLSDLRSSASASVVLRASDLRAGTNRLLLRYAWTRSPAEVTAGEDRDPRRLGMAWDLLRFGTGADARADVRAAGGQLALPFGCRMSRYLRLPPGAVLALDGLRARDDHPGELRVFLQPEGGVEREVARLRARRQSNEDAATVELNAATAEPVRISIAAVAGGAGGGGLVLRRPILAAPRQSTPHGRTAATGTPAALRQPAAGGRPRNVILYLVDALRADHLGCYGYGKPVSPHIDAFAREAVLFRHAVAQAPWTRPSVATILTGLLPRTHGVNRKRQALAAEAVTLAEVLRERGYRTAGFVTNGNVARAFGFAQGFDTYQLLQSRRHSAVDVNTQAAAWLAAQRGDAPFFLYLHTVEPHAPYNPPTPFRQRFASGVRGDELTGMHVFKLLSEGRLVPTPALLRDLTSLYDAEIAANDAAFGALRDLLVRRGLWDDTIVVFLSDHGEELFDHGGWQHGRTLHAEMLDVPLIVRVPGAGAGRVVMRQVQHADVMPTILAALHLPPAASVQGRSFLAAVTGKEAADGGAEEAYSWLDEFGVTASAVTTPEWRLIAARAPIPATTLYDRRSDPGERQDLAPDRPVRTGYLAARLHAAEHPAAAALRPTDGTSNAELRRQLRALGYAAH